MDYKFLTRSYPTFKLHSFLSFLVWLTLLGKVQYQRFQVGTFHVIIRPWEATRLDQATNKFYSQPKRKFFQHVYKLDSMDQFAKKLGQSLSNKGVWRIIYFRGVKQNRTPILSHAGNDVCETLRTTLYKDPSQKVHLTW